MTISFSANRLTELTEIGRALARERNVVKLTEQILLAAKRATRADGGSIYLMQSDEQKLQFALVVNDTLGIHLGGTSGKDITFSAPPLTDTNGAPNHHSVVAHCVHTKNSIRIADAYDEAGFDFTGARNFDKTNRYRSKSFLTVPMLNHENEVIGVLQLINARDQTYEDVIEFTDQDQAYIEALAAQAAIAVDNRLLFEHQERLFEAFINMINTAIDEKSAYTGGHCQRVPVLTMMIAKAAHRTTQGPLAAFQMTERDEQELWIAGLMHDCGKITTPVHVVDKATKLQTIFDRVALIDTRFELLTRDAHIRMLERVIRGAPRGDAEQEYFAELEGIESDREFIRYINLGQEKVSAQDLERVRSIAERRWSGPEGPNQAFLSDEELENLMIPYGTLTKDERQIINHHIVSTIKMLESLPWPKHLKNVPEYAGGHHERMDGKGYPKGLLREQMSWQARMMGIADIFEALTARDRPYKEGKKLSETLQILGKMCANGHIDPDLFEVFIREKVYLEYAKQFMPANLIDEIDLSTIPGFTGNMQPAA